jgi:hypothetical protein
MLSKPGNGILCAGVVAFLSCSNATVVPFWEIEDSNLPDIAMARADPNWGSAVVYNPEYCEQIGDACGFFRAHAHAHIKLNHTLLASPKLYPALQEAQADCFVGKYGKPHEIRGAVKFLLEVDTAVLGRKIYGDPVKLAEAIRKCAMEAGRWIGD